MRLLQPLASGTVRVSRLRSLFWARWCVISLFAICGMGVVAPAFADVNAPTNSGTCVNAAPSNFIASNVDECYAAWQARDGGIHYQYCVTGGGSMQYGANYYSNGRLYSEGYGCQPASVGGGGMAFYPIYYCPGGETPQMGVCPGVTPTLNSTPNPEKNFPSDRSSCPTTDQGNPINAATGLKHQTELDYEAMQGLAFRRIYTSVGADVSSPLAGPFGAVGWRLDWHRAVVGNALTASVIRGKGAIRTYTLVAGVWKSDADITAALTRKPNASGQLIGWSYVVEDGSIEQYSAAGKLISVADTTGRTTTLSYSDGTTLAPNGGFVLDGTGAPTSTALAAGLLIRITDPQQRSIRLGYDTQLRVVKMTDPVGGVYRYAYDTVGNLVSVSYPDGSGKQYRYENAVYIHALTAIIDENGNRYAGWVYDEQGRALSSEHANGVEKTTLTYNSDGTTSTTNALGIARTQTFQVQQGVAKSGGFLQPGGSGCAAAASSFTYDVNGNIASKDDFTGQRSCFTNDLSRNLPTVAVEGLANTANCSTVLTANASLPLGSRKVSTQWHPDWRLVTKEAQPLSITTSVYNGQPDPFNANANASCAPATAKTPDGKPIAVLCKQVVQATTDADGGLGLAATLDTSVAQRVSSLTYDALGRTLTSIDPLSRMTTYAYYSTSTGFSDPNSDASFDSVSLLLHGDGANGSTVIADSSLVPKTVTAGGNAKISTAQSKFGGSSMYFDGVGDYVSVPADPFLAMKSSDFTIEMWIYKLGNSVNTSRLWNPNGDFYADIYMGIDANGNLVTYGSTNGTSWNSWAFGTGLAIPNGVWKHVALVRSGGTVTLYLDGVGTVMTTALGTTALYDGGYTHVMGGQGVGPDRALNGYLDDIRITKGVARYTANFTPPTQAFPNVGATVIDPNAVGHTVGDLQSITNAAGHVTQFTLYDAAGRVRQMVDAKGVVTDTTYTPRGWVASVTTTAPGGVGRTTSYSYDGVGQLTQLSQPDGTTLGYSYDAAHRLVGVTDARGNAVNYTLDDAGNRIAEEVRDPTGALQRSISRSFDALNRLQQVTGAFN